MSSRTLAQHCAAADWRYLKNQVRYWASWKYTPVRSVGEGAEAYAAWVAHMRNAWVAFHAGESWMTRADEFDHLALRLLRDALRERLRRCEPLTKGSVLEAVEKKDFDRW